MHNARRKFERTQMIQTGTPVGFFANWILMYDNQLPYYYLWGTWNTAVMAYCMVLTCHFVGRTVTKTTKESLDRDFIEHAKTFSLGDSNFSGVFFALPLPSVPWSLLHLCPLSSFLPKQFSVPFICSVYYHCTNPSSTPFIKAISIHNNADRHLERQQWKNQGSNNKLFQLFSFL